MAKTITVSALNLYVKSILEEDANLGDIAVEGEISNFVNHYKSGHYYFALKDETSLIKTVMFSSNNKKLKFVPENGMKVIVRGKVSLYEKDGTYQLYAQDMFQSGLGLAHLAFEKLKAKLEQEGLFDPKYKKPIPKYPFTIGVATSATGAALQDIISVVARRFPCAKIVLAPCGVQGDNAKQTIINAIKKLDNHPKTEVIIIARGGGSKEDMWVFNDEDIARTAFACKKTTISAVGHEIDFTILDFVCDVRAATPTAAAELALPDINSLNYQIMNFEKSVVYSMESKLTSAKKQLDFVLNSKGFGKINTIYQSNKDRLERYTYDIKNSLKTKREKQKQALIYYTDLLESNNPLNNLKKGYSLIYSDKKAVAAIELLSIGQKINVVRNKQTLNCTIDNITESEGI